MLKMVKMQNHRVGNAMVTSHGKQYDVKGGVVEVLEEAVNDLLCHGYKVVVPQAPRPKDEPK